MRVAQCSLAALFAVRAGAMLLQRRTETHGEAATAILHFDDFLQKFDRSYAAGSAEYKLRRSAYEHRHAEARRQNSKQARLWTAGVNHLWDWTGEEFARLRGWRHGARPSGQGRRGSQSGLVQLGGGPSTQLPQEKSWAHLVAQKHIHNQGACGSCWAIAGATVLQAHTQIHTGKVRTFSAQQLVSCVQNPQHCGGDGGCRGATVELAYAWVMNNGLAEDYQVPYAGADGSCGSNSTQIAFSTGGPAAFGMHGWERLPENQYEPLLRALAERGPVAVSVSGASWAVYENGIYDGCPVDAILDHAVVLTGYGLASFAGNLTQKFWRIQNSWGVGWGEEGKIRLVRHDDEGAYCGIDAEPEKGTGCAGGPAQVKVCGTCGILYDNVIPHF